jgi:hypothetical protein
LRLGQPIMSLIFCAIVQHARLSASVKWMISISYHARLGGMVPRDYGFRLPFAFLSFTPGSSPLCDLTGASTARKGEGLLFLNQL